MQSTLIGLILLLITLTGTYLTAPVDTPDKNSSTFTQTTMDDPSQKPQKPKPTPDKPGYKPHGDPTTFPVR